MHRKVATAIVVLVLLVMAAFPARTDASSSDQGQTDLSSLPRIEAYLTSIGVDLDSVVVQQGRFNYAGPNCPGDGWNCTVANVVVQISSSTLPAANVFDCLPTVNATIPTLNECVIVQSSVLNPFETETTTNKATCTAEILDGSGKSKCKIRQSSKKGNNYAEVRARTTQRGSEGSQTATQDAVITQVSDTGKNTAKITQTIEQTLRIGAPKDPTQQQEAHQTAQVDQTSGSGANSSDVQQTMLQVEDAESDASITQEQNTDSSLGRNQEATVNQTSETGTNTSNLRQQLTQRQDADTSAACVSPTCTVTQHQGNLSGGQRGKVTQTTGLVVIQSTGTQNQDQTQDADTLGTPPPALIRTQLDPQDCCATHIGGTADNFNLVTQVSVQNQTPVSNQSSFQNGDCTETVDGAECTVAQTYTANGGTPNEGGGMGMTVRSHRVCGTAVEAEGGCEPAFVPEPE